MPGTWSDPLLLAVIALGLALSLWGAVDYLRECSRTRKELRRLEAEEAALERLIELRRKYVAHLRMCQECAVSELEAELREMERSW